MKSCFLGTYVVILLGYNMNGLFAAGYVVMIVWAHIKNWMTWKNVDSI